MSRFKDLGKFERFWSVTFAAYIASLVNSIIFALALGIAEAIDPPSWIETTLKVAHLLASSFQIIATVALMVVLFVAIPWSIMRIGPLNQHQTEYLFPE